tara:strand:- start:1554 stop:1946 length:393 start_codon:yes stop_codon:yes gene_type:complete
MSSEVKYPEFRDRIAEALDDLLVKQHRRASTVALFVNRTNENKEFARRWLKGYTLPKTEDTIILAKALNVNEEWLTFGTGEKTVDPTIDTADYKMEKLLGDEELVEMLRSLSITEAVALKFFIKTIKKGA